MSVTTAPIESDSRESSAARIRTLYYQFFPGGGIARYTHELLSHVGELGDVDLELVCMPSYHWRAQAEYQMWPHLREIHHANAWRRRARFLAGQFVNPRRLLRRCRATRPHVVHFSNINHLTVPLWLGAVRRSGAKVAATVHDVRRAAKIVHRGYEDRQLTSFYRQADALFVHSEAQKADLVGFAGCDSAAVHVVPHGPYDYGAPGESVEQLRLKYRLPIDKRVALCFGNVRDEKNLDLLLRALPRFKHDLHLLVAGRGGARGHRSMDYYRRLAVELNVERHVSFVERYIPDEDVPELFCMSDWVALPYQPHFTSQSGVLNVAANYARPMLLSRAPTFAEVAGVCNIGVVTDVDSVESLSAGVQQLQAQVAESASFQFEDYLERFGWRENARRTVAVYRELTSRHPE